MLFDDVRFLLMQELNILHDAATRTGLTVSDVHDLLECELETGHLLDYITALQLDRMN
jgi:hypothetical protein